MSSGSLASPRFRTARRKQSTEICCRAKLRRFAWLWSATWSRRGQLGIGIGERAAVRSVVGEVVAMAVGAAEAERLRWVSLMFKGGFVTPDGSEEDPLEEPPFDIERELELEMDRDAAGEEEDQVQGLGSHIVHALPPPPDVSAEPVTVFVPRDNFKWGALTFTQKFAESG